ncbi:prolyl oligopeptidase family serine peptidase [Actinosynnema sp. NPDC023587]|uniref:alpha/beta hydrolase family protein n=1 Tax=Actinosynnema sp. NPDC023587 TaxID=3154695 RepID=UPI0033F161E0
MSTPHHRVLALAAGLAVTSTLLLAPTALAETTTTGPTGIRIDLPALSGRYPVGTTDLHLVDHARQDPWRPADERELMITVTYPAQRTGQRADWMTPGVARAVGEVATSPYLLDVPADTVDWSGSKRRARTGATAERTRGDWPVVLFSHGFGSTKELNAGLTDDLASRGYVVASLSHTGEAAAVEFPDGRVVPGTVDQEDAPSRKAAIDARVADSRFVLDQLTRLDRGDNPDAERDPLPRGLAGSLDLSKVGIYGHSYGGYTAGETMYHDRRFDAGINIDGAMGWGEDGEVVEHGLNRPFLLVGGDFLDPATGRVVEHSHVDTALDPTWAAFWPKQRGWKRDLHFDRSTHYSFTDLQIVAPQLARVLKPGKKEELVGAIDATRSLDAQHEYFGGFFDHHLKRREGRLFGPAGPARHPDTRFIA